ncbi:ABC transporter permease [Oceanidesulfovibrio marinus]|jgi:ABC-type dipeptide/oligopeptide/nickel transport system permease component|uniref:ABC transporter permease n=1 Tax=Oceanidesulfovibrio marinus TaxID=370038 RepID=A0A6P1ZD64_9BACT|nr:ABC transporter permease [Oceanidesulfovibrio marinus]QJT10967.1 ABC transporter permease [Oceanidesulfovibrio marinus]TVM31415.1 ABC transporter permease [Oceanidesulfovibrio marinus]
MLLFILKRIVSLAPVLFGVSVAAFLSLAWCPGDPAEIALRTLTESETPPKAAVAELREQMGLDRPLYVQYWRWLGRTLHGDLGHSYQTGASVVSEVKRALGPSTLLAGTSTLLAMLIVIPLGALSAARSGSLLDRATMAGSLVAISIPDFCIGILLFLIFSVRLDWLPVAGYGSVVNLILPALTLAVASACITTRLMRTCMVQALEEKYVITARSKGMGEWRVAGLHAMKNALPPVLTYLGAQMGYLFGGAVVVESIFLWPGLGRLLVEAVKARDVYVVQGCILAIACIYVLINLMVDIVQAWVDPRIQAGAHHAG